MNILEKLFHDLLVEFKKSWWKIQSRLRSLVLIPTEIAGLSIDHANIHYVSLNQTGDYPPTSLYRQSIPLINQNSFGPAIKILKESLTPDKTDTIVLSLPNHLFYSTVLQIPKFLNNDQVQRIVESHATFISPVSLEEIHLDWEKVESDHHAQQEVFLWVTKKTEIHHYLENLKAANFLIKKIEPAVLSTARIIQKNQPFLLINLSKFDIHFSVIERKVPRLTHHLNLQTMTPNLETSERNDLIIENILRVLNFYQSEKPSSRITSIKQIMVVGHLNKESLAQISLATSLEIQLCHQENPFNQLPINTNEAAFGATQQKLSDQGQSNLNQIIINQKKDYQKDKIITLLKFWQNLSLKIFGTLITVLIITYFFIWLSDQRISQKINSLIPGNLLTILETSKNFNNNITVITSSENKRNSWSPILDNLLNISLPGVKISHIAINQVEKKMTLKITLAQKGEIVELKNKLEKLNIFQKIVIPFEALNNRKDLDFNLELEFINQSLELRNNPEQRDIKSI